jgi:uncharacterized membrane protein YciS (DUF1049 family)
VDERSTTERDEAVQRRRIIRLIAIGGLLALAIALAFDNRQEVRISWLLGDTDAPLVLALVVAFALGWAVGWLASRRRRH